MAQASVPGYEASAWFGLLALATPPASWEATDLRAGASAPAPEHISMHCHLEKPNECPYD